MKHLFKTLFFSLGTIILLANYARCQDVEVPKELFIASGIPDSLKENANSVLRFSMIENDVKGPGKQELKIHKVITILNEKADDLAGIALPYNKKFSSVGSFEMKVYDADGKLLKKYHKNDMYEHAAETDETIVTDDRVMEVGHTVVNYPSTVEISFEMDQSSLMGLGDWEIQSNKQSVQNSYYTVSIGDALTFRYRNKNTNLVPVKTVSGHDASYTWQVHNLKAVKHEEGSMEWRVLPSISFVANQFVYYGQPGDMSTWQGFGNWIKQLNSDVCSLSPAREAEIREMTDTIKTDKEKARFLYEYMQRNMRYVNITLGIGGLKPFPAAFVDEKKYGDCKALSNYMCALLKAAGIRSYYAIVNSGENEEPVSAAFPENAFDHVILCIPFKNDTTWLECTSNTQPFGKLGTFTENRNALVITEDGGKLITTPKSKASDNQFLSETHVILDEDGGAKAQVKITSTGEVRDIFVDLLPSLSTDKQKQMLLRSMDIKQPASFNYDAGNDINGVKQVSLDLDFDKFCDIKAGDKIFYHPYVLSFWDETIPIFEKRKTDYYFEFPFEGTSVTTIDLPKGFEVESLPATQSLKFTYGDYSLSYTYDTSKNEVVGTAKFNLNNQLIPAGKYTETQEYLDAVAKAQNKKLVIRRKA